jgi:hypothetical protein
MIKTFRGLLDDGAQDRIRLSTKKGKIGYRMLKLQIITNAPGTTQAEHIVKVYKIKQTTIDGVVDLSDGNLLGVAQYSQDSGSWVSSPIIMIMEQEIFNQDIYITGVDVNASAACNYYLELETINLTDNAASVSTLRDIRSG